MADLFLFVQWFFQIYLKRWDSVFTDNSLWLHRLMKRSAESADRVKEQSRWDGCCWCDSLGHYLSSCCKCCMTLSSQVTEHHKACTFKDACLWLSACLPITDSIYVFIVKLNSIWTKPNFTVQLESLCSVKRNAVQVSWQVILYLKNVQIHYCHLYY